MKHYVLGLIFNKQQNIILLVKKKKPTWQAGHWNGIGGKIKGGETPIQAMNRESHEETNFGYTFVHVITFVCPGGTVFVFKAISIQDRIPFNQVEDEELKVWDILNLPPEMMGNLRWIIPLSLSSVQLPIIVQQTKLGVWI